MLETTRRRAYIAINLIGMAVQAAIWLSEVLHPSGDLATLYFNPAFFVMCGVFTWWLLTNRPIVTTERAGLLVFCGVLLFRVIAAPLSGEQHVFERLQDTSWLIMIASVISFLVFDFRRAVIGSSALYLAGVTVPWLMARAGLLALDNPARLIQTQLLPGMTMIIMWSLAWYREHFALEQQRLHLTEQLARTDALTGLPNRHALYPLLSAQLEAAQHGSPGNLLLIDLDHFKSVNDRCGHNVGDAVLSQAARLLQAALPPGEVIGRWGGEEFLALVRGPSELGLALAEKLRRQLAQHDFSAIHPAIGPLTVSIGVAGCGSSDSLQSVLARADGTLYAAKRGGRNQVCLAERPIQPSEADQDYEALRPQPERPAATEPLPGLPLV